MVAIIGRSAWGALPPNRECGYMNDCDAIVLHHSATTQPRTIHEASSQVQAIDRDHLTRVNNKGKLIFCDIAYNLLVGPDCYFVGRGPTAYDGATDDDQTTKTVSICILGNYMIDDITAPYKRSIEFAVEVCRNVWGNIPVRPHHDFYATGCPGINIDKLIPTLNGAVDMTADEFFTRPITLSDGEPPVPYPTTVEGWFIYTHRELQIIRNELTALRTQT